MMGSHKKAAKNPIPHNATENQKMRIFHTLAAAQASAAADSGGHERPGRKRNHAATAKIVAVIPNVHDL